MNTRPLTLCACLALLGGCAGGSHSSALPPTHLQSSKVVVTFVINAPQQTTTQSRSTTGFHGRGVRPQYLSPATQSMTMAITGPTTLNETASLTVNSSGCTSTLASVVCTLSVALLPCTSPPTNCYTATLTTYDQTGGTGNVLSAAQAVVFTVAAGQSNAIGLTLSGVPARTLVIPANAASSANGSGGYDILGLGAHKFIAESLDADGNIIFGVGAPLFAVGAPSGTLSGVTTAPSTTTPSAPNSFTVTPPTSYASGTASFTITPTFAGQATDGCAQAGANCSAVAVTVDMAVRLYVVEYDYAHGYYSVTAYDQNGNQQTLSGSFAGLYESSGIAYDPSNGFLYVTNVNLGNNTVSAYDLNGNPQTLTGSFPGLNVPNGIVYDPSNGFLYVTSEYGSVTAYDQNGNQQTLTGSFPDPNGGAYGIAYDPSNGFLYVANSNNYTVTAYDQNGNQQTLAGSFSGVQDPIGIGYDPNNGFLYVTNGNVTGSNSVKAYDQNGNQQTLAGSFSGASLPEGVAYNPSNGFLYVVNHYNSVTAYDQNGNQQTLSGTFPGLDGPAGIAIVP